MCAVLNASMDKINAYANTACGQMKKSNASVNNPRAHGFVKRDQVHPTPRHIWTTTDLFNGSSMSLFVKVVKNSVTFI